MYLFACFTMLTLSLMPIKLAPNHLEIDDMELTPKDLITELN